MDKLNGVKYITCVNCGKDTMKAVHFKICKHCNKNYEKKQK